MTGFAVVGQGVVVVERRGLFAAIEFDEDLFDRGVGGDEAFGALVYGIDASLTRAFTTNTNPIKHNLCIHTQTLLPSRGRPIPVPTS